MNALSRVEMHVDFGLESSMDFIASSDEVECSNGWMMADLFGVDRTAIDESLEGLSEYGVKGFFG